MRRHKTCHDLRMKFSLDFLQVRQAIVCEHCFHEHREFEFIELFILDMLFLE